MITSPSSSTSASERIVFAVMSPAGTITHTVRGFSSFETNSSSEVAPSIPSLRRASTASAFTS